MMQNRAADFRLDATLRDACASDIEETCGFEKVQPCLPHRPLAWQPRQLSGCLETLQLATRLQAA